MRPSEEVGFIAERCCLPLLLPSQNEQQSPTIEAAEIKICLYPAAKDSTLEDLQIGWKTLLYRYLYTETISFVLVENSALGDSSPHGDKESGGGWKPQASLRQFHNVSLDTLERRHCDAILPLSPQNSSLAQVNTAIQVFRPATHGGLQQQVQSKPKTSLTYNGVLYDVRPASSTVLNVCHVVSNFESMKILPQRAFSSDLTYC